MVVLNQKTLTNGRKVNLIIYLYYKRSTACKSIASSHKPPAQQLSKLCKAGTLFAVPIAEENRNLPPDSKIYLLHFTKKILCL